METRFSSLTFGRPVGLAMPGMLLARSAALGLYGGLTASTPIDPEVPVVERRSSGYSGDWWTGPSRKRKPLSKRRKREEESLLVGGAI